MRHTLIDHDITRVSYAPATLAQAARELAEAVWYEAPTGKTPVEGELPERQRQRLRDLALAVLCGTPIRRRTVTTYYGASGSVVSQSDIEAGDVLPDSTHRSLVRWD